MIHERRFMRNIKTVLIVGFWFVPFIYSLGQSDECTASLQKAQKLYNQGMIEDIASILRPCIENGFTRNQRNEAYKLIILASLLDGNQQLAENTMIEFLKKNPEYEVMPNDPVEFVYLFESYRTLSVFSIGLKFGANLSDPMIIEPYSAGDLNTTVLSDKLGVGYQAGIAANRYVAKHLFINLEFNYCMNSYKFTEKYNKFSLPEDPVSEVFTFKETVNRVDIPLSIGYEFESKLFNYFIRIGGSYSWLFTAHGNPEGRYNYSYGQNIQTGVEVPLESFREKSLYFCHAGLGIKYKVPRGYLVADFRYNFGLNNIVLPEKRFETGELLPGYYHIDDDFSITNFAMSFGYYFSFYQPRKKL